MNKDVEREDIDYLHPEGKPVKASVSTERNEKFDGRDLEAAAKREKSALIDTDGHHICSQECRKKHRIATST